MNAVDSKEIMHPSVAEREPSYDRIHWLDSAKAICIFLVVVGHAAGGIIDADLVTPNSYMHSVFYLIYTFHMPAFFLFSGVLAAKGGNKKTGDFFLGLSKKIVYPYFLWRTVQYFTIFSLGDLVNHPIVTFDPLVFVSIIWKSGSQFWFLKALFLMHVMYFCFRKWFGDKWFLLLMILLRGCSEVSWLPPEFLPLINMGIFYAIGLLLRDEFIKIDQLIKHPYVWMVLFWFFWLFFALDAQRRGDLVLASQSLSSSLMPASLLGSLALIFTSCIRSITHSRVFQYVGQLTMPIYLLHVFFVAGARIAITNFLLIQDVEIIFPIIVFSGLVGPLLIFAVAKHYRIEKALALS